VKLFPYQLEGAEFLASRRRAALYDDIGLGKTAQACHACKLIGAKRVLVVCPASLKLNWHKEWAKFGDPSVIPTVVSYNFMREITKVRNVWDVVIADESQHLAKPSAKQTINFIKVVATRARRIWILSASPAVKSAADYHPQLSLMLPGRMRSYGEFKKHFCNERTIGWGKYRRIDVSGFRNTDLLNSIIKKVALRRMKEEVLHDLPSKRFSTFWVDIPIIDIDEDEVDASVAKGKPTESIIPPIRELGLDKAKEATEYIRSFNEPLVIWTWFRDTADYLGDVVLDGVKFGYVTGRETTKKKQAVTDKFQAGKLDVIVANIAAGGTGHTWTRAATTLFIELPFSPALYEQSWGRIYRIGTKRPVNIISVLAENSLDERLLTILKGKSSGMRKCLA
jgi:SWI/SNF-related matrix-associated actin-dependent regulator 1 of chromatin subfamily A